MYPARENVREGFSYYVKGAAKTGADVPYFPENTSISRQTA